MQALLTAGQKLVAELSNREGIASVSLQLNGKPLVLFAARGQVPAELLTGAVSALKQALEAQGIKTKAV
jgi:hypothetical protein